MSLPRSVRALMGTAVLCVLSLLSVSCASDALDDACDAGCVAGEACQDGGCIDEACVGVVCPDGQVCTGGDCVQPAVIIPTPVEAQWGTKKENGEACAANRDCNSGSCADGVCCDSACNGACDACSLPGNEGVCTVSPRGTACDDGDACTLEDVCDGESATACGGTPKECKTPPNQCHETVGTCSEGACTYTTKPVGTACDDGNACTSGETCGTGASCGSGTLKVCESPGGVCLENAGACQPETGACSYTPRAQGSACRAAVGPCDVAEVCTGAGGECPPDLKQPAGTACVDDGNPCTTDVCDASGSCLHPVLAMGTVCGAGSVCNASAQCISSCFIDGALVAAGTTNPSGACQVCDPARSTSAWSFKSAATQCRGAADACDAVEYCTGSGAQCPADGDAAAGTSCGAGSICDASGQCSANCFINGTLYASGATNPAGACQVCNPTLSTTGWSFKPATTQCRGAAGVCDTAEYCSGSSAQCPGDAVVGNGTTCGGGSEGAWSACEGFSGTCGETGTQSRTVTAQACFNGGCQASTTTETRACTRSTQGNACGSSNTGSWGTCGYSGTCGESGSRSRTVTEAFCNAGACQPSSRTETEACTRDTDGITCGTTTTGSWGSCGYSSTCDEESSRSRTITERICSAGTCQAFSDTETADCERNTEGDSCGTTTTGSWSSCGGYSSSCDESGKQWRNVTTRTCSSGSCGSSTSTEEADCSRSTSGNVCGTQESAWSACGGFSGTCDRWGSRSRTMTLLACGGGSCGGGDALIYTKTEDCERDTTGDWCNDGNACTTGDTCDSGGSCSGTQMSCPGGGTCSNGVCPAVCNGPGEAMCNDVCTNLVNNNNNCGGCGIRCAVNAGEVCQGTDCVCVGLRSEKDGEPGALPRCAPDNPL
ncbi:putative lipoprotein [Corallococcus coralloides]|uniref:Putative lipoprotein n=1 Tax=Corallococcus coralloides TaxID=184914 RepID=A0A410RMU7_CORCK|nr:hypothetical protein [Corallococcus coralloides]QAT83260.1 putative lipoprotein [Corallococcus coralloides]